MEYGILVSLRPGVYPIVSIDHIMVSRCMLELIRCPYRVVPAILAHLYSPVQSWRKFSAVLFVKLESQTRTGRRNMWRGRYALWHDIVEQLHLHTACGCFANVDVEEYNRALAGRRHFTVQ